MVSPTHLLSACLTRRLLDSPPARKKQRLSSPAYEGELEDLSQDDLKAFDEIEARLSQPVPNTSFPGFGSASNSRVSSLFTSASSLATGFASARDIPLNPPEEDIPDSDEPPPEPDYEKWFESTEITTSEGFQTAKSVTEIPQLGFTKASGMGFIAPSAAALEKAREWLSAEEPENEPDTSQEILAEDINPFVTRPILRTVENGPAFTVPSTPTPAGSGFARASNTPFKNPAFDKSKAFKPHLTAIRNNVINDNTASPLNPNRTPTSFHTPVKKTIYTIPSMPISALAFRTPARASPAPLPRLGFTPAKGVAAPGSAVKKFSTPFKAGMRPGEPGRVQLQKTQEAKKPEQLKHALSSLQELAVKPSAYKGKGKERVFFDLGELSNLWCTFIRLTLRSYEVKAGDTRFIGSQTTGIHCRLLGVDENVCPICFAIFYSPTGSIVPSPNCRKSHQTLLCTTVSTPRLQMMLQLNLLSH